MCEYIIFDVNVDGYDKYVLCLTFESLLFYIRKIEAELAEEMIEGKILIDLLLVTGNGTNRFVSCVFSNGQLDFKTAQNVTPAEFFRKETVEWLHDNYSYVKNSILTEEQRQKIKDNIAF